MSAGVGVNCLECPEKKSGNCDGNDLQCVCFKCPRKLSECIVTKYCRETESVLYFGPEY
ncbi:hypothetical protein [Clostridium sp.]|uniref:hypothetical protein n=1 Tax=Clostridium sp. TaxID=1506 RepID=UPI002FCBD6B6